MPNPSDFDSEESFMSACIREVKSEGKGQDQAIAQCASMWRRSKTKKAADLAGNLIGPEDE